MGRPGELPLVLHTSRACWGLATGPAGGICRREMVMRACGMYPIY